MTDQQVCSTCGYPIPAGQAECPNCGAVVAGAIPAEPLPEDKLDKYLNRGRELEKTGDLTGAVKAYKKALGVAQDRQRTDSSLNVAVQTLQYLIEQTEKLIALRKEEKTAEAVVDKPHAPASPQPPAESIASAPVVSQPQPAQAPLPPPVLPVPAPQSAPSQPDRKPGAMNKTTRNILIGVGSAILLGLCCLGAGFLFYDKLGSLLAAGTGQSTRIGAPTSHSRTNTPAGTPTLAVSLTPSDTPTAYIEPTATLGIGSTLTRSEDGMLMVYIPEGEFTMGVDENEYAQPAHVVYLDSFWIDRTEVTNAMFRQFIDATGYRTDADKLGTGVVFQVDKFMDQNARWPAVPGADWLHPRGRDTTIDSQANYPVVQVSWNDASAYCDWAGARLPTEAEWEKAARGNDERTYPWGNGYPNGDRLNYADSNLTMLWADQGSNDGYEFTAPVGSYPDGASPYGALDMAGNVDEWVHDWYGYTYYGSSPKSNPTGPDTGFFKVTRGGRWSFDANGVRSFARTWKATTYTDDTIGFRCAVSQK